MAEPKTTANTPPIIPQSLTGVREPAVVSSPTSSSVTTHKIRISLPPDAGNIFYKDETNILMSPLRLTDGFLFPIQPAVSIGYDAKYQELTPTHTNFPYQMYQSSSIKPIALTGDFVVRNQYDAQYVNAGIHFLRCLTRMFNYMDGEYAGAPPHVVRLHGMGFTAYDNLPCVLTDLTLNYSEAVDHITFQINKKSPLFNTETARIPVFLTIGVSLTPVFSRDFVTNVYTTKGFSSGKVRLMGRNEKTQKEQAKTQDTQNSSSKTNAISGSNQKTLISNAIKGATTKLPSTKISNLPATGAVLDTATSNPINTNQQPNVQQLRGISVVGKPAQ